MTSPGATNVTFVGSIQNDPFFEVYSSVDERSAAYMEPGITASDMTGFKADGNLYLAGNATERVYLPEEVAETACFLLSDVSGCISGQVIVCNNGKTINPRWK